MCRPARRVNAFIGNLSTVDLANILAKTRKPCKDAVFVRMRPLGACVCHFEKVTSFRE